MTKNTIKKRSHLLTWILLILGALMVFLTGYHSVLAQTIQNGYSNEEVMYRPIQQTSSQMKFSLAGSNNNTERKSLSSQYPSAKSIWSTFLTGNYNQEMVDWHVRQYKNSQARKQYNNYIQYQQTNNDRSQYSETQLTNAHRELIRQELARQQYLQYQEQLAAQNRFPSNRQTMAVPNHRGAQYNPAYYSQQVTAQQYQQQEYVPENRQMVQRSSYPKQEQPEPVYQESMYQANGPHNNTQYTGNNYATVENNYQYPQNRNACPMPGNTEYTRMLRRMDNTLALKSAQESPNSSSLVALARLFSNQNNNRQNKMVSSEMYPNHYSYNNNRYFNPNQTQYYNEQPNYYEQPNNYEGFVQNNRGYLVSPNLESQYRAPVEGQNMIRQVSGTLPQNQLPEQRQPQKNINNRVYRPTGEFVR